RPKKVTAMQITEAAVEMIKARMGVKVFATWIIQPYLHSNHLALIPVTKKGLFRSWYAITLKRPEQPQYLDNFINHLKRNISGMYKA
ncbi:MAG: LysR substrate-binding domain-containing protein, partial [Cytophagales bacterium]|nr:LysR substrate-binding domain-containing protein [Cytophagales bacterium]